MISFKLFYEKNKPLGLIETITFEDLGPVEAKIDSGNGAYNVLHGLNIAEDNGHITFDTINNKSLKKKLEESDETQIYTNKDMADLLQMAHKMRIEELKAQTEMEKAKAQVVKTQVNIQDNSAMPFGQGNYGELIKKLMKDQ